MRNEPIVRRYTEGLVRAVADEREFAAVAKDVRDFLGLFHASADLRAALLSPFIPAKKKAAVLESVLARAAAGPKASRFLGLLLQHKRLDLLAAIVESLDEAWAARQGILTFEVTSAAPLAPAQRDRLTRGLEAAEGRPVRLVAKVDPAVIGGVAVRRGHVVFDASVEGRIAALEEQIRHG